jgi:hypothetical protein
MANNTLFDIAPQQKTVSFGAVTIPVPGVSLAGLIAIASRFPEVKSVLGGGSVNLTGADLMEKVPAAATAFVAYGLGHANDEAAEKFITALPIGDQLKLFDAVFDVTIGEDGLSPMLARVNALSDKLGGAKTRATSQKQSKS